MIRIEQSSSVTDDAKRGSNACMLQKFNHSLTQIIGLTAPANCSSFTSNMLDRTDGLD
uniref:Uncharacterized protein n=1 Tax=Wuchereria bancrofti TaxID=6293 RepID=A0AAF5Q4R5_WUCBA